MQSHQLPAASPPQQDGRRPDAVHYTAFIRVPFARGDFEDPPLVDWNADKDHALWAILSRTSRSSDLNCMQLRRRGGDARTPPKTSDADVPTAGKELAVRFQVTVPFILQQAAWLYERQLSGVRAQMLRVGKDTAPALGQTDGSGPSGHAHVPSVQPAHDGAASTHSVDTPGPTPQSLLTPGDAADPASGPPTGSSPMRRTPSNNATLPIRAAPVQRAREPPQLAYSFASSTGERPGGRTVWRADDGSPSPGTTTSSSSSSASEDDGEEQPGRMRPKPFKRPSRFGGARNGLYRSAHSRPTLVSDPSEHEDEDATPLLTFHRPADDLASTLKGKTKAGPGASGARAPATISSPASSNPSVAAPPLAREGRPEAARAEAARKTYKGNASAAGTTAAGRNTSDGTPSMGSSFSDLDDTSVTQSALEEALLSNMQHGGGGSMASRTSTYSRAVTGSPEQRRGQGEEGR